MFDINYLKQEDFARKINLLKQVKTTLESVMFDRGGSSGSSNFAHSFNGVITIFCRNILAVLEDGIVVASATNQPTQSDFLLSSPSSLSSSPTNSFSASPHFVPQLQFNSPSTSSSPSSRKTTVNSNNLSRTNSFNVQFQAGQGQALWAFVLHVFNEYYLQDSNENGDEKKKALESLAQKDFKSIKAELSSSGCAMKTASNEHDTSSSENNGLALEWISVSLRRRILLNQIVYLLSLDETLLRQFYRSVKAILCYICILVKKKIY